MIRIAVSKGRVAEGALKQLGEMGYCFSDQPKRQLWAQDQEGQLELIYLKAQDVPIYVAQGVADFGIVGCDVLEENPPPLMTLLDLKIGRCQMCLAGPAECEPNAMPYLRLASKYPNLAQAYLASLGKPGAVMPLQGSVELAPLLGISDLIVDLVESGQTLRAHGLRVHEVLFEVSARLVANPALYRLKTPQLSQFVAKWKSYIER